MISLIVKYSIDLSIVARFFGLCKCSEKSSIKSQKLIPEFDCLLSKREELQSNPSIPSITTIASKKISDADISIIVKKLGKLFRSSDYSTYYPSESIQMMNEVLLELIEEYKSHNPQSYLEIRCYNFIPPLNQEHDSYKLSIFKALELGCNKNILLFLQFYLCSPHIHRFLVEEFFLEKKSAVKMLSVLLHYQIPEEYNLEMVNKSIVSMIKNHISDLACDKNISCNLVWQDLMNDQSYVKLMNNIAIQKITHDPHEILTEDSYLPNLLPARFFDYDLEKNIFLLTRERVNEYARFPPTIVIFFFRSTDIYGRFECSQLFIDKCKYLPQASFKLKEDSQQKYVTIKKGSEWKKMLGQREIPYYPENSHSLSLYCMYTIEDENLLKDYNSFGEPLYLPFDTFTKKSTANSCYLSPKDMKENSLDQVGFLLS